MRYQPIHPGSAAIIADAPSLRAQTIALGCFLWPTAPLTGPQTVLSRWREDLGAGWRLGLDAEGHLVFEVAGATGSGRLRAARPLLEREWVFVGASYDAASGALTLVQRSLDPQGGRDTSGAFDGQGPAGLAWPAETALVIAAHARQAGSNPLAGGHYNSKIDRPRLFGAVLPEEVLRRACEAVAPSSADPALIGAWDFSQAMAGETVRDLSTNRLDGRLRHLPMRAMTGANWDGSAVQWTEKPELYGAIHFHSDDMADCGWSPDLTLTVPVRLAQRFLRAAPDRPRRQQRPGGKLCLLLRARPARTGEGAARAGRQHGDVPGLCQQRAQTRPGPCRGDARRRDRALA